MNCCRETTKMGVPPGNRPAVPRDWFRGVPKRYVAGADTRGRREGRPYPWSQQVIHEISGLKPPHPHNHIFSVDSASKYSVIIMANPIDIWAVGDQVNST
jgi:hypothetical protein